MKKLSLLLIALLASLMSWAQTDPNTGWVKANAFAYDLRVSYSSNMSQITLSYVLSGDAIPSGDAYATLNNTRGVQVYVYDSNGNQLKVLTNGGITKGRHSIVVNASDYPYDETLTWEVVVHGNKGRSLPQLVASAAAAHCPENAYGIGVDHAMYRREFGQILVSRAKQVSIDYPCNTLLEYTPQLGYVGRHDKNVHNGNTGSYFAKNSPNYEPNRVKISEDGRMFVSSYHPTAAASVLEYLGANNYRTVINNDRTLNAASNDTKNVLNRRTIGMDVMGKGDDLKIVVAWMDANGYNGNEAKVEIYEYALGKANMAGFKVLDQIVGQNKTNKYVRKIAEYNAGGLLYQSFMNDGYSSIFGFLDVAYDQYGNVWMKIDYADKASCTPGKIVWFKNDGTETKEYSLTDNRADGFYGGSAVLVTKDNVLFTGTGEGVIQGYDVDENGGFAKKEGWTITDNTTGTTTRIGRWVTGLAVDVVNNLHAVTEGVWSEENTNFTANIVTIALPYSGQFRTTSPKLSTFARQNTTPIPNICATNLRYKYTEDRCEFSFKVNTKPKMAQIRFYDNKQSMINSVNTVHADNYSGNNKQRPSFVYNIPADKLRTGLMKIELGMCSGKLSGPLDSEGCEIINDSLPAGEWYWSVYVEAPRRSTQFAATYKQPNDGVDTHYRLHAAVNTYPETDGFGEIYVAQYNAGVEKSLMVYGFHPNNNFTDEDPDQSYSYIAKYINPTSGTKFENQRRPVVAPDGKVYIADHGATNQAQYANVYKTVDGLKYYEGNGRRPMLFTGGGIYVWDPKVQTGNTLVLTQFLNDPEETSSCVTIWNHNGTLKLYGTNTYGEFEFHLQNRLHWKQNDYTQANQTSKSLYGWNGFKEYTLGAPNDPASKETTTFPTIQHALGMGDAGGNTSIVAMDKGIWMCQHRENDVQYTIEQWNKDKKVHALPDNVENYLLSFVPYNSDTRTWTSCTTKGINYSGKYDEVKYNTYDFIGASALTQTTSSPVQSAPGAGMTYRRINGVDYIFMVQHTGDIAQLKVTWSGDTPTVTHYKTYPSIGTKTTIGGTSRKTGTITTMCFDYAGNLITTAGATYFGSSQDLIVYTMPYPNRVNAQEIQAPNSCVFIPERLSQEGMNQDDVEPVVDPYIISPKNCTLDFYRTLQTGSFNSICLPFSLSSLSGTPYAGAKVMKFEKARLEEVGGEQHLYFDFFEVTSIEAGVPYLIQPKADVFEVKQFKSIKFEKSLGDTVNTGDYADFIGTFAQVNMNEPTTYPRFMVVADNRLAEIDGGIFRGFRAYFHLLKAVPANTLSMLHFKKDTPTGMEIVVDGKVVNVEKLIREGRVYIRAGETLYTVTGEVVSDRR